jgi:hypothetical protein
MDRLRASEIIEKWTEELLGVCVTPKKQKKMIVGRIKLHEILGSDLGATVYQS